MNMGIDMFLSNDAVTFSTRLAKLVGTRSSTSMFERSKREMRVC